MRSGSETVLPAYIIGMIWAKTIEKDLPNHLLEKPVPDVKIPDIISENK